MQRREGIVRDLRPRVRSRGEKGRLAGIGQADETRVGDQLQPQPEGALDTLLSGVGVAWRLIGGRLEPQVAPAAVAAARQQDALAGEREVRDDGFPILVEDLGADRNPQHHVFGALAGALLPRPALAVLREEMLLVAIVDQRVQPLDRLDPDVATLAAVTPVRPAEFDELLASEADAAVAARPRTDVDARDIEELHGNASDARRIIRPAPDDSGMWAPSRRGRWNASRRPRRR